MKKFFLSIALLATISVANSANSLNEKKSNQSDFALTKQTELLYPMVWFTLSCTTVVNYPWSNVGAVFLDMVACCPASAAVFMSDLESTFCGQGEPIPGFYYA